MSDLIRRVRQVLAEAELLSEGSTQSWNKSSPNADQDHSPKGERSLTDSLRGELTALVDKYEGLVDSHRKRERWPVGSTREEYRQYILSKDEYKTMTPREVSAAEDFYISHLTVWRWRNRAA